MATPTSSARVRLSRARIPTSLAQQLLFQPREQRQTVDIIFNHWAAFFITQGSGIDLERDLDRQRWISALVWVVFRFVHSTHLFNTLERAFLAMAFNIVPAAL